MTFITDYLFWFLHFVTEGDCWRWFECLYMFSYINKGVNLCVFLCVLLSWSKVTESEETELGGK